MGYAVMKGLYEKIRGFVQDEGSMELRGSIRKRSREASFLLHKIYKTFLKNIKVWR